MLLRTILKISIFVFLSSRQFCQVKGQCVDQTGVITTGKTCAQLLASDCYNATFLSKCCQTCKAFDTSVTGCEYGDKVADCVVLLCEYYANPSECCATCKVTTTAAPTTSTSATTIIPSLATTTKAPISTTTPTLATTTPTTSFIPTTTTQPTITTTPKVTVAATTVTTSKMIATVAGYTSTTSSSQASYHCEVNPSDANQIIFKFRLQKNDDTVKFIKMYNASETSSFDRATDEQSALECTKSDDSSNTTTDPIDHNIVFNPSIALPCGMVKQGNIVKAVFRSEATANTDSAIDKFYICQCDITEALEHIINTSVQVSDIQHRTINNARSAVLEIYDSGDALVTSSSTKHLGDIIYFRVTYTRNVATERVFPVRAYVDELDVASVSTFSDAVKLIDNGCPTAAGSTLAGNSFGTFSNNSARSTEDTWVLETPKFQTFSKEDHIVGTRVNFFRARLGYCFLTSDPICLSPSCPARKKRDVEETVVDSTYMQTILIVQDRGSEADPGPRPEPDCSKSVPFILIVTLMLVILVTEITITGAMSFKVIRRYRAAS